MKRILLVSLLVCAASSHAVVPITTFNPGKYLGEGFTLADNGVNGSFASLVTFVNNGWNTIHFHNGALSFYESVLNIDANGFFVAQVTDSSNAANPIVYFGKGNCGTKQCQLTVTLRNGTFQKSIIFNDHAVRTFGAVHYNDGTPDVQWNETLLPIPSAITDTE